MRNVPDFYRQIKDNTGYIIHPDEIIADNFSFIMTAKAGTRSLNNFSAEGRQLLDSIQQVISEK
ncbi:MAG: hypothetical protein IPL65_17900 [Lewinellaceae bacterium]|nr:hypothetical protein [Lewinellaceae bacterium]